MKDYGLVSVIMPAYNSASYISEAIKSVINQTYPGWELIIVDDASTDDSLKIIQQCAENDQRISVIQNPSNLGTHHSRNKGIKAAKGDFISFLDADDLWKTEKLEIQLKMILKEDLAACFSSYDIIDENGKKLNKRVHALPLLTYQKLLKANYVGNLTGIYSTGKLGKIYSPNILKRQDWILWLEVIKEGGSLKGIQQSLAFYRVRKNSISTNKLEMLKYNFNVYHKILGFSLPKSLWKMLIFFNEQFFIKSRQIRAVKDER